MSQFPSQKEVERIKKMYPKRISPLQLLNYLNSVI